MEILQVKVDNKPEIELGELKPHVNKERKTKQFIFRDSDLFFRASEGKTWKEAKLRLNELFTKMKMTEEQWKMTVAETYRKVDRKRNYEKWESEFLKITGLPKPFRCRTMYMLTGLYYLNVFELENWLGVPSNVSLKDFLKNKWGNKVVELAEKMI